ncbi:hypothetical protein [Klenkia brasiliensis]|uniref:Integral membrane protein n=1 Tax=Klenkia brasiliensis TaxID=333142 RepID=A0A1G7TGG2_9ACTN|nr:hypothetical protein [Klenkia brasiliensis]SDG34393.1 hypothetical protein SAMN05660324_2470 [Klenkia brasiliensis]
MTERTATRPGTATPLLALRVAAAATVLVLAWQFVTAGQLLGGAASDDLHAVGAIALHVVALAAAAAALWLRQRTAGPLWPSVVAVAVFAASFVQAALGSSHQMAAHVPGALVLTVGSVWVLAWSLSRHPVG